MGYYPGYYLVRRYYLRRCATVGGHTLVLPSKVPGTDMYWYINIVHQYQVPWYVYGTLPGTWYSILPVQQWSLG